MSSKKQGKSGEAMALVPMSKSKGVEIAGCSKEMVPLAQASGSGTVVPRNKKSGGPELFMGKSGIARNVNSSTNRQSVAMKLRLRQIEENWSRLFKEIAGLKQVEKILIATREKLVK